jgi:hypothetical protein
MVPFISGLSGDHAEVADSPVYQLGLGATVYEQGKEDRTMSSMTHLSTLPRIGTRTEDLLVCRDLCMKSLSLDVFQR